MVRLEVEVTPRSRAAGVAGRAGNVLKVRVAALPADGRANAELIRTVAGFLGVPRDAVTIRHGGSGRRKLLEIEGVSAAELKAALSQVPSLLDP